MKTICFHAMKASDVGDRYRYTNQRRHQEINKSYDSWLSSWSGLMPKISSLMFAAKAFVLAASSASPRTGSTVAMRSLVRPSSPCVWYAAWYMRRALSKRVLWAISGSLVSRVETPTQLVYGHRTHSVSMPNCGIVQQLDTSHREPSCQFRGL